MKKSIIKYTVMALCMAFTFADANAQTASPKVYYIDSTTSTGDTVFVKANDSQTTQAPLEFFAMADLDIPDGWQASCEWIIYDTRVGEESPILTRHEENTSYTLTSSGSFSIKLYVTFTKLDDNSTVEVSPDPFTIVISESELKCPNAFSPNDDGKNDILRISCKSIVKLTAYIFNRWGQKLATKVVNNQNGGYTENGTYYIDLWDGRINGKYAKDGAYLLNLDAYGSDGIHYHEKKTINLIKGFNEESESSRN